MAIERSRPFGSTMERWQPFRALSDVQAEMNRLFDNVFASPTTTASGERMWAPRCDMWETRDEVVISFELPGVGEKDVTLSITGDLLTVNGERRFAAEQVTDEAWHRLERAYGRFERTLELPMPVQPDKVSATYRDGVLVVTLPKAEDVKSKEIKINIL
jgi:HSP20 family protein